MTATPADVPVHWIAGLTDEELARRAQAGSMPCFAELVDRFEGRLFDFLRRRTGSVADAEDLTQDAFVRAWEHLDRYEPRWRFSTWLFTIAGRLAVNRHRRVGRWRRHAPAVARDDARRRAAEDRPDAETHRAGQHLWALAGRVLTERQHAALWLRYAEDLSIGEIAQVMGRTPVSVRVMLFRARRTLATAVSDEAADPAFETAPIGVLATEGLS